MQVIVDCSVMPATTTLADAENFKAFEVVVIESEYVWIAPEDLVRLAGDAGEDPQWQAQVDSMVTYAGTKGWLDRTGRIRAHVSKLA